MNCIRSLLVLALAGSLSACATSSQRATQFPSSAELEALGRDARPRKILPGVVVEPEEWMLEGPLPERMGVVRIQPSTEWENAVLRDVNKAGGSLTLTEGLRCFAREYARFYLERGARPGEVIGSYLQGACGVSGVQARPAVVYGDIDASHNDAALVGVWRGNLRSLIRSAVTGAEQLGGVAFARSESRGVAAIVVAERPVVFESFDPVPNERQRIVVRGRLQRSAERLFASVNQGLFGYADCVIDPETELPEFAIACEIDPDDDRAWLEIGFLEPGRLLGKAALSVLVRKPGVDLRNYRRRSMPSESVVSDTAAFRQVALAAVNDVRDDAGLEPLVLEEVQSDVAERLAPAYFAGQRGLSSPQEADVIALGLMAGWDVRGPVRKGSLSSAVVAETQDVIRWLGAVLESPFGRSAILDPDSSAMAVGPVIEDDFAESSIPVMGAVVATYALFDDSKLGELERQIFDRLVEERTALGLEPPRELKALEDDAGGIAARLQTGQVTPVSALHDLIQTGVDVLQRPVQGYLLEMNDLDQLEFPEGLLGRRAPEVSVTLTRYEPDGEPWGRYVILFVTAGPRPMA